MTARPQFPFPDPQGRPFVWQSQLVVGGVEVIREPSPGGSHKALLQLDDVKSVELHVSGLWLIVEMSEGTTSWIRIPERARTIEFQREHEAFVIGENE